MRSLCRVSRYPLLMRAHDQRLVSTRRPSGRPAHQDVSRIHARAAEYVDKIMRGAKPSDLPIEQAAEVLLVINLKTAKTLGLTVPSR